MSMPAEKLPFDAEAYLAWEAEQPYKNEYLAGEIFAMSGASDAHVTISLNLATALRTQLRGTPCRVFMLDMKLRIAASNAYFYPDAFVTCDQDDRNRPLQKNSAVLVAEVLSPSTSAYDRGQKFAHYRKLPELREYALIDSERLSVDLFRRDDSGHWVLYPSTAGEIVEFASVGLSLPIEVLYEDVSLELQDLP